MAKRFTDTGKWDKAWFRKLEPLFKVAWQFLCDRCDHAGVWEVDEDALEFFIGEEITVAEILQKFDERVRLVGNKLVIVDFAEFQYGNLNPENRVHKSVLERLEKVEANKGLVRPLKGSKDTDTDKDTDKDKEKGECEGKKPITPENLAALWNENRGALPEVKALTKKRRDHAKAQLQKHQNAEYWAEIISRWRSSDFCTTTWRPDFDDLLNENKRIKTLEGKYDNRANSEQANVYDWAEITGSKGGA